MNRASLWFSAIAKRGDSDKVIALQFLGDQVVRHSYFHANTDAIGAYYRHLSQPGIRNLKMEGLGSAHQVPYWRRILQTFAAVKRVRPTKVAWPLRDAPLAEALFFPLRFDAADLRSIEAYCSSRKIAVRALLLATFHGYFASWIQVDVGSWLIPVSLRRRGQISDYANLASYFLCPISCGQDAAAVHATLRSELKRGRYWGTYYLLSLLALGGARFVAYLSNKNAERGFFMGTFSDLGRWTFEHDDPVVRDQMWSSAPIASTQYPIGIAQLIINGKMSVGIRINRNVQTPNRETIANDLEKLRSGLLRLCSETSGFEPVRAKTAPA